jgi:hypothetical protein
MTDLSRLTNPFRDNVVQDAWQSPADVEEIHDAAFRACLAGIESAASGVPDSLFIYGPAGSGKTHLLTRVQRHLALTASRAPDRVLRCVFVFVRLQTAPQMLWQHVRRRLATDLMRRDQGITQLERLFAHQWSTRSGVPPRLKVLELRVLSREYQGELSRHVSVVATNLSLPRDLGVVVEHLLCNRSVRDASAWLAGESLPEAALTSLGLGPDTIDDREEAAREVVTALCRLAGETLPIVFCFDQVEALQRASDDREAFFRFGRMAADLHDADPNVFLVTCLQSAALDTLRGAVRQADFERMAKRHVALEPLNVEQVRKLVRSRLECVAELKALRSEHPSEPYFPLSAPFVDQLAAEPADCVPRRVLSRAAQRFEQVQHGRVAHVVDTPEFLATQLFERQQAAKAELGALDTPRVVLHGLQLMARLRGQTIADRDTEGADLVLEGKSKVALSVRNETDGRVLGPKLRKLLEHTPRKDGARVVIVRDPRLTIAKTAVRTRQYLDQLQTRGASIVEPTVAALSALEALTSLLSDAKSGDLANDGESVSDGSVLAWLRGLAGDLSLEPIEELMDAIEGDAPQPPQSAKEQDLADLMASEHVMELEAASRKLSYGADDLLIIARRNSERFLVLDGPPLVLLDVAGTSPEVGERDEC